MQSHAQVPKIARVRVFVRERDSRSEQKSTNLRRPRGERIVTARDPKAVEALDEHDQFFELENGAYKRVFSRPTTGVSVSRRGVCVIEDHNTKEHISIEKWKREQYLFESLRRIAFFNRFFAWRTVYRWCEDSKQKSFSKRANFLSTNHLVLDRHGGANLLKIRAEIQKIVSRGHNFLSLHVQQPKSIDDFARLEVEATSTALSTMEELFGQVKLIVESTKKRLDQACILREDGSDLNERSVGRKKMVISRLFNYMCDDARVSLVSRGIEELSRVLCNGEPVLNAKVGWLGNELHFSPSEEQCVKSFKLVTDSLSRGCGAGVRENAAFIDAMERIRLEVNKTFERCSEHVCQLVPWTAVLEESCSVSPERISVSDPPLSWIRRVLCNMRTAVATLSVEGSFASSQIGFFVVDNSSIPEVVTPSALKAISTLESFLPLQAERKLNVVAAKLMRTCNRLKTLPTVIEEVGSYLAFCRLFDMERFESECNCVIEYVEFMETAELRVPESLALLRDNTFKQMSELHQLSDEVEETRQRVIDYFSLNVSTLLDHLQSRSKSLEESLSADFFVFPSRDPSAQVSEVLAIVSKSNAIVDEERRLNGFQNELGVDITPVELVRTLKKKSCMTRLLWETVLSWSTFEAQLLSCPWKSWGEMELASISSMVSNTLSCCAELESAVLRDLRERWDETKRLQFIIDAATSTSFQPHHWRKLDETVRQVCGTSLLDRKDITLDQLKRRGVERARNDVCGLLLSATQEIELDKRLSTIVQFWNGGDQSLRMGLYRGGDQRDVWLIDNGTEVTEHLEESANAVRVVLNSQFCQGPVRCKAEKLLASVCAASETVVLWMELQRRWVVVDAILRLPEVGRRWTEQGEDRFPSTDKFFRDLVRHYASGCKVLSALGGGVLLENLREHLRVLGELQLSVASQLDLRRSKFPRLYFINDIDLLDLLSSGRTPDRASHHISKLFETMRSIDILNGEITGIIGTAGETVNISAFRPRGDVEAWLIQLEKGIQSTLRAGVSMWLREACSLKENFSSIPLQSSLLSFHVLWCEALGGEGHKGDFQKTRSALHCRQDCFSEMLRTTAKGMDRLAISSAITQCVMLRDATERIHAAGGDRTFEMMYKIRDHCRNVGDSNPLEINMVLATQSIRYGWEYGGMMTLWVPPSPRAHQAFCFVATSMGSMCHGVGIQGANGVGKTDFVKQFAHAVGRHCAVVRCSQDIPIASIGASLRGAVQCGSICCFDNVQDLPAVSSSILGATLREIVSSLRRSLRTVSIDGHETPISSNQIALFATLPDGEQIPDQIRSIFRPTFIVEPSFVVGVEILLVSSGFHHASDIAQRLSLLQDMLSNSSSPSLMSGALMELRSFKQILKDDLILTPMRIDEEHERVANAIVSRSASRLGKQDLDVFHEMVGCTIGAYNKVGMFPCKQMTVTDALQSEGLIVLNSLIRSVENLVQSLRQDAPTIIVGKLGAGKTAARRVAKRLCQQETAVDIREHIIYPKAMSCRELFGSFDASATWRDGCLHVLIQSLVGDPTTARAAEPNPTTGIIIKDWVILDGTVSDQGGGSWLEFFLQGAVNLAERTMCFGSGSRLDLPADRIRILLEVPSLQSISPSIAARLNLVVVDDQLIDHDCFVTGSVEQVLLTNQRIAPTMSVSEICSVVGKFLQRFFFHTECASSPVHAAARFTTPVHIIQSFVRILQSISEQGDPRGEATFQHRLAFALTWSVGSILDEGELENFDLFCRDVFDCTCAMYPASGLVFDYCLLNGRWVRWCDLPAAQPRIVTAGGVVEFSANVRKVTFFRELLPKTHLMVCAPPGIGRSCMLQGLHAATCLRPEWLPVFIKAHHGTSPSDVFTSVDASGRSAAGEDGGSRNVVLLVDDVHLPSNAASVETLRSVLESPTFCWDPTRLRRKQVLPVGACVATQSITSSHCDRTRDRFAARFHHISLCLSDSHGGEEAQHPLQVLMDKWRHVTVSCTKPLRVVADRVLNATLEVFHRCLYHFPEHHHRFSLHHLRDALFGLVRGASSIHDVSSLASLWSSECHRAFGDRFGSLNTTNQQSFARMIDEISKRNQFGPAAVDSMWSTWSSQDGHYEPLAFNPTTQRMLASYCMKGALVTEYLMRYACKVWRVLSTPGSHGLLVGQGMGLGQRFAVTVACARAGQRLVICDSHLENPLIDAVRHAVSIALGMEGLDGPSHTALLVPNVHLMSASVLTALHRLLNGQDWGDFFPLSELEGLRSHVRARNDIQDESTVAVDGALWGIVQERVTVLMTATTSDAAYTKKVAVFPSLITHSTPIMFVPWPLDAMEALAMRGLGSSAAVGCPSTESSFARDNVEIALQVHACVTAAQEGQQGRAPLSSVVVSTTSFMDYVHLFRRVYDLERTKLDTSINQLQEGITAIRLTTSEVAKLGAIVEEMEPTLAKKSQSVSELLDEVREQKERAVSFKDTILGRRQMAQEEEHSARAFRAEAENELLAALPEFNAALEAVRSLQKSDVDEIRRYNVPTPGTSLTMEAVMTLLGERSDWVSAKTVMGGGKLLDRMLSLDVPALPPSTVERIQQIVNDPEFTPSRIRSSASEACASICRWVCAVQSYHTVYVASVAPRQKQLADAEMDAAAAKAMLKESQEQLKDVQQTVVSLEGTLTETRTEQSELHRQLETCQRRLKSAQKLTDCLGQEAERWGNRLAELTHRKKYLSSHVHVFAAVMSYGSALGAEDRATLLSELLSLDAFDGMRKSWGDFHPSELVESSSTVLQWQANGLPADRFIEESALFVVRGIGCSKRWPLLIDPDGIGLAWLCQLKEFQGAVRVKASNEERVLEVIKQNIRDGIPTLIEDVNYLIMFSESTLLTLHDVLHRNVQHGSELADAEGDATASFMRVGDELITYNPSFRLALVCSRQIEAPSHRELLGEEEFVANCSIPAEVAASVRVVNFTPTTTARADLLLSSFVEAALGPVETERRRTLAKIADLDEQIESMQAKILDLLTITRKGTQAKDAEAEEGGMDALLDNEALMAQLLEMKRASEEVIRTSSSMHRNDGFVVEQRETLRVFADTVLVCYDALSRVSKADTSGRFFVPLEQLMRTAIDAVRTYIVHHETLNITQCLFAVLRSLRASAHLVCLEEDALTVDAALVLAVLKDCAVVQDVHDISSNRADISELWAAPYPSEPYRAPLSVDQGAALRRLEEAWDLRLGLEALQDHDGNCAIANYSTIEEIPSFGLERESLRWSLVVRVARPDLLSELIPLLSRIVFGSSVAVPAPLESLMHLQLGPMVLLTTPAHDPSPLLCQVASERRCKVRALRCNMDDSEAAAVVDAARLEGELLWVEDAHLAPPNVIQELLSLPDVPTSPKRFQVILSCPYSSEFAQSASVRRCFRAVMDTRSHHHPRAAADDTTTTIHARLHSFHLALVQRQHFGPFVWSSPSTTVSPVDLDWCTKLLEQSPNTTLDPYRFLARVIEAVYTGCMTTNSDYQFLLHLVRAFEHLGEADNGLADNLKSNQPPWWPRELVVAVSRFHSKRILDTIGCERSIRNMTSLRSLRSLIESSVSQRIDVEQLAHPSMQRASQGANSLCAWLFAEVDQFNGLLEQMSRSAIESASNSTLDVLQRGGIPASWLPYCPCSIPRASLTLAALMRFLSSCHGTLVTWLRKGQPPSPIPLETLFSAPRLLDTLLRIGIRACASSHRTSGPPPLGRLRLFIANSLMDDWQHLHGDGGAEPPQPMTWVTSGLVFSNELCWWNRDTHQLELLPAWCQPARSLPPVCVRFVPDNMVEVAPPPPTSSTQQRTKLFCSVFPDSASSTPLEMPLAVSRSGPTMEKWALLGVSLTIAAE